MRAKLVLLLALVAFLGFLMGAPAQPLKLFTWFVGFAPAKNPTIAVAPNDSDDIGGSDGNGDMMGGRCDFDVVCDIG